MKTKSVIPRAKAHRDVEEAVDHYLCESSSQVAVGFIDALHQAYGYIGRHSAAGSPRYGHELNLPGLRAWPLANYPYLVFYVERANHVEVWRVLHAQRDIPAWMSGI